MRILVIIFSVLIMSACSTFGNKDTSETPVINAPITPIKSILVESKNPESAIQTPRANFAYIADTNGRLLLCKVAPDNGLNNCTSTGLTPTGRVPNWLPNSIDIHVTNNIRYAYIASNSSMYKCNLNNDNTLVNCVDTGTFNNQKNMSWLPTDIVFSSDDINAYAYISAVKSVYRCSIVSNGDLVNCATTGYGLDNQAMSWVSNSITFNHSESKDYAYVAGAKHLYKCDLSGSSELINCATTGTDAKLSNIKWHPKAISFSREAWGYYAYVSDPSKMYECNVYRDGSITNCNASGLYKNNSHWLPDDIDFSQVGNNKYAYVAGIYGVFMCSVGKYGALTNCNETGFDPKGSKLKWNPKSIQLIE